MADHQASFIAAVQSLERLCLLRSRASWCNFLDPTTRRTCLLPLRSFGDGQVSVYLGSGSNVDQAVIRTDGTVDYTRDIQQLNPIAPLRSTVQHSNRFNLQPGVTPLLKTDYQAHPVTLADVIVTEMEVEE